MTDTADAARFQTALRSALTFEKRDPLSIGMQNEKTLHAVLKAYEEPDSSYHEIRINGYIADICRDGSITEIQTARFDAMRAKLAAFLPSFDVRIVYPIPHEKWVIWVDPLTGHPGKKNRSPKKGSFADAFRELYRIRPFLTHPNLTVELLLIDMEEYRLQDGWGKDGKRGSHRFDRVPLTLSDSFTIHDAGDYAALIPETLEEPFTSAGFAKAARCTRARAQTALLLLTELGAVERCGRKGRSYIYTRKERILTNET